LTRIRQARRLRVFAGLGLVEWIGGTGAKQCGPL
jgi:hypothetical protein